MLNNEDNFNEKLIRDLTETSNKIFRSLKNGGYIPDKALIIKVLIIKEHVT